MTPDPLDQVKLTHDLLASGYSKGELARLTRTGELRHLRRGAYAWAADELPAATGHGSEPGDGAAQHRQLILATTAQLTTEVVVSHRSAAVLHGLPVSDRSLDRVQVTRSGTSSGKRRGYLHLHAAPLHPSEVVELDGVPVTSLARTVVDLGRSLSFEQAVTAGDAALRAGCAADELSAVLVRARSRPGVAAARRAVEFSDGRSESPGESLSRIVCWRAGLPAPELQFEVFDDDGILVGRTDFCWEAERTLGEFDGKVKYGRLLKPGEASSDVIYREKRREDALRALGWQVVRWNWTDLRAGRVLAERLQRAFDRTARRRF